MIDHQAPSKLIPPHGGYRDLKPYQMAEMLYDATVKFYERFIDRRSRTYDRMVQAARSGKQNQTFGITGVAVCSKAHLAMRDPKRCWRPALQSATRGRIISGTRVLLRPHYLMPLCFR